MGTPPLPRLSECGKDAVSFCNQHLPFGYRNVQSLPKSFLAVLGFFAVLAVLISPALDELPGTAPHILHHSVTLSVISVPHLFHSVELTRQMHVTSVKKLVSGTDLLILECTRLC
jgi:hypothetical protein